MDIYNLSNGNVGKEWVVSEDQSLIIANEEELPEILKILEAKALPYQKHTNIAEDIRFESHVNYDFLSFVYYETKDNNFVFENFNLYLNEKSIILVVPFNGELHDTFIKNFTDEFFDNYMKLSLSFVYYQLMNQAFTRMFEALSLYENHLVNIENEMTANLKDFEISTIVTIKNTSFRVKKYNRQLLYVGDQLILNDNGFINDNDVRYLHNIDSRINKLYEYSDNIYEMGEHLMALYDSNITSQTNKSINKLTILTVFATPLTVITGLYGMNFINMPELQNEYGYFIVIGIMLVVMLITFVLLKRSKLI